MSEAEFDRRQARRDALRQADWMRTYLLWCPLTGLVKIGKTSNLRDRMASIAIAAPVRLLAVIEGDVERALHSRFADLRVYREWFRPDGDLLVFIGTQEARAKGQSIGDSGEMVAARRDLLCSVSS